MSVRKSLNPRVKHAFSLPGFDRGGSHRGDRARGGLVLHIPIPQFSVEKDVTTNRDGD